MNCHHRPGFGWRSAKALRKMLFICAVGLSAKVLQPQTHLVSVHVLIQDADAKPIQGVEVRAVALGEDSNTAKTASDGIATVQCSRASECTIDVSFGGYLPAHFVLKAQEIAEGATFQLSLSKAPLEHQNVVVHGDAPEPLTEAVSIQTQIAVEPLKTTPLRPATLADALPLVPGVSQTPDGRVIIEGTDESHSVLLVNSVNVTDPATGSFGLSVPVDTVDKVNVSMSPFLAQYGNFITGVVSADTRRGGEKWSFNLNDPLPEFRIRSGHLQGLRSATPRLNIDGPVIPSRLYFLEGFEYLINKATVRTLPFPQNQTRSDAVNSFTQFDCILNQNQTITATLHFAPHSIQYANLNYFDPEPVTPNVDYREYTGTLMHRWAFRKQLLTSTFSGTRMAADVNPQQQGLMILTPTGNQGSYFGRKSREATRFQWLETWAPESIEWHGKHSVTVGSTLANAEDEGTFLSSTTFVQDAVAHLLQTIEFSAPNAFRLADLQAALYVQDHWVTNRKLALDLGIRTELQTITHTRRLAPRAGFTFLPNADSKLVIRGGAGVFYSEVPLSLYAFATYPRRTITTLDGRGNVTDGPRTYLNLISTGTEPEFPLISQNEVSGNFAPYSIGWNLEAERTFGAQTSLRVRYLHNDLKNQITLDPVATAKESTLVLGNAGKEKVRQFDIVAGFGNRAARQFFISYVHQTARGDQSDANTYFGDLPSPVIHQRFTGSNPGEIPNRFLFWGTADLPYRMHVSPHLEWRNGFPYQPVDVLQRHVDFASSMQPRFPNYFTVDATVSKDINISPKHAVRFSVTGFNITNHLNPFQVHANTADPQWGTFFGNYGRHLVLDFDVLF